MVIDTEKGAYTMDAVEIVNDFMRALQIKEYEKATGYLTDDFLFSGWTRQPLNASQFMDIMGGLKAGFPNLSYNFEAVHSTAEWVPGTVEGMIQVTGDQSAGFILPAIGTPPIPEKAVHISLPQEHWIFTLENGKISRLSSRPVPGGGIEGILNQMGISLPIEQ
jgi:hypothetical protein